ncbi:MAG: radical SAM protein, partial [Bacteroidota bacterium]
MNKSNRPNLNIVTLGCPKNLVDSEILHGALSGFFNVSHNGTGESYHTIIINTCGFILDAKEESIDVILHYVNEKERGRVKKLLVFGCLSQRYPVELAREIPEVDKFYGAGCYREITEDLTCGGINEISPVRIISTPMHYAYLKIAEGCNRRCSFCAIPSIRGRYRSFDTDLLINEAGYLAENGVKELILIAQDLTYYGFDKSKKPELTSLIKKLADIKGIEWIRLHYAYPNTFPDTLISLIYDNPKICRYVDIPLQHISDKIL